jgi:UDP-2-acetamido-3-amino-2,3-dideoxy-glucuronate N-acetyltransferase
LKGSAGVDKLRRNNYRLKIKGKKMKKVSSKNNYYVHPSSYIDGQVRIGKGTKIWHFCHITAGSKIGKNCKLGQNVYVGPDVKIGNNVKIQNNVSVYPGVTLEDDVFCGPSMVFTNIINPRSAYPQNSHEFYYKTLVKKGASIGANATIVCGNTVGRHSFIGAGSVVTRDVPDYALVYGNPARIHGWICECGLKIEFQNSNAVCKKCNRRYVREGTDKVKLLKERP